MRSWELKGKWMIQQYYCKEKLVVGHCQVKIHVDSSKIALLHFCYVGW